MDLAYCVPRGIPHSFFLGGPNEWTAEDRGKVHSYRIRENERCLQCGQFSGDWQDPETLRPLDDPPAEPIFYYCEPCMVAADKKEELPEDDPRKPALSLRWQTSAPRPENDDEGT